MWHAEELLEKERKSAYSFGGDEIKGYFHIEIGIPIHNLKDLEALRKHLTRFDKGIHEESELMSSITSGFAGDGVNRVR